MTGDLHYMAEQFGNAVNHLAVTDDPLRERVRYAYTHWAHFGSSAVGGEWPQPSPELVARVKALTERVTQDGPYDVAFNTMTDAELEEIAEEIYEINAGIDFELAEGAPG